MGHENGGELIENISFPGVRSLTYGLTTKYVNDGNANKQVIYEWHVVWYRTGMLVVVRWRRKCNAQHGTRYVVHNKVPVQWAVLCFYLYCERYITQTVCLMRYSVGSYPCTSTKPLLLLGIVHGSIPHHGGDLLMTSLNISCDLIASLLPLYIIYHHLICLVVLSLPSTLPCVWLWWGRGVG